MGVEVFISYSHEDVDFAETLEFKLEREGINVWRDKKRIPNGAQWGPAINEKLEAASLVALILSPYFTKSAYATYEWCYAHFKLNKPLYPVYVSEFKSYNGLFERLKDFQLSDCLEGHPTPDKWWDSTVIRLKNRLRPPLAIKEAGHRLIQNDEDWPPEIRKKNEGVRNARKRVVQELSQLDQYDVPYRLERCYHLLKGIEQDLVRDRDGNVQIAIVQALPEVCDCSVCGRICECCAIPTLVKLRQREEEKRKQKKDSRFYKPLHDAVDEVLRELTSRYS